MAAQPVLSGSAQTTHLCAGVTRASTDCMMCCAGGVGERGPEALDLLVPVLRWGVRSR